MPFHDDVVPSRATLPPPEWTAPATLARVSLSTAPQPLARRKGGRAEEASMRARVAAAHAEGESDAERDASATLARWLASRDRDLDEAIRLVDAALALGDDPELRRELSAWLESMGEPGRAAAVLEKLLEEGAEAASSRRGDPLDPAETAFVRIRVGVLHARAGAADRAAAAFADAVREDPSDPLPCELRGALAAWAPEAVSPAEGSASYLEAARRRAAQGSADAELEDVRRAFATDPSSGPAAAALATAIASRGKAHAAVEAWRAHASALVGVDAGRARAIHARLRAEAEAAGDLPRALGAALDEGLDDDDSEGAVEAFDLLLLRVGLLELLASRLEARAAACTRQDERAKRYEELARLCGGALADSERAAAAHVAAIAADPTSEPSIAALAAQLGDVAKRLVVAGGEPRLDPLRRFCALLCDVPDEASRRARLVAQIRAAAPEDPRWASAAARLEALSTVPPMGRGARGGASPELLEHVAEKASPQLKAVLLSAAADRWLASASDPAAPVPEERVRELMAKARRAAERACQAEPGLARAVATHANVVLGEKDRAAAAALERALNVAGARASWCAALADALEALGENGYAVAWTQRYVALRPGDVRAIDALIARILRARDAQRLGDTLAWVLSQPHPFGSLAARFAEALGVLADLDDERAVVLARRALDVFGPKHEGLRDAMLAVADKSNDDAFAAAVLERWVSTAGSDAKKVEIFSRLADRRHRMGDPDAEARVVARSVRETGEFPMFHARVARLLGEGVSHDGELSLTEARAELLARGGDDRAAASALRDLGAGLWDLASDPAGAVRVWVRAAKRAPVRGFAALGVDLVSFGGAAFALETLVRLGDDEAERDVASSGALMAEAARVAVEAHLPGRAFDLAVVAITRNLAYADALEIAERAAAVASREDDLSALYDAVGARALGRFGRRAAHYRGARYFEQRGLGALALRHAAQAFLAVPTEGATFVLLARTAERAGDRALAMRTVEQVAERARESRARAAWLLRAAMIAGPGEEGARRRVDVLLTAAVLAPDLGTLAMLKDAAEELLRVAPEEREVVEMRLGRARKALMAKLDGPEGTRITLALAEACLSLFDDAEGAIAAIEKALSMDADLEEYGELTSRAGRLAKGEGAHEFLERAIGAAEKPYANVGVPALALLARMAGHVGDRALHARAVVGAAERDADDDSLVLDADAAVRTAGDAALEERLTKKVSRARRVEALRAWARERILAGAHAEASAALERASELASPGAAKDEVERELRSVYEAAGRGTEIDQRAEREAEGAEATPAMRAERWTEIAERRENRRDLPGAIRALSEAAKLDGSPVERWSSLERVAELAGDDEVRVGALREIAERVGPDGRIAVYKRLARAHERRGDLAAAEETWRLVSRLDLDDEESDHAVEAIIVQQARYAELVDHLAHRAERLAAHSGKRETLRAVRLRRAAILEQRLGRLEDACDELTLLLAEWPDNASALRYLADLRERAGDHAKAAPLWRRAAALEHDRNTQDELELRASRASSAAGDTSSALRHVRAVLIRNPDYHDALTLHVELARAGGDASELGEALEALATAEASDGAARSDMLVEAAQVAARIGDAPLALARAQKAAQVAPDRAAPQLLARGLEYRLRGAGDPAEARRTIDELKRIRAALAPEDDALRAFLLAEALDVVQGGGAGMRELASLASGAGSNALCAVGIAERLAAQGNHSGALPHFGVALRGSLLGLRKAGSVALAAAESAVRCMQVEEAAHLLQFAAGDPETRILALARGAHLAITQGWLDRAENALVQLARTPGGDDRARTLLDLVRMLFTSVDEPARPRAEAILAELLAAVPEDSGLHARLVSEIDASRRETPAPRAASGGPASSPGAIGAPRAPAAAPSVAADPPPAAPSPPPEARPLVPDIGPAVRAGDPSTILEIEAEVARADTAKKRAEVRLELARAYLELRDATRAESTLWLALGDGSIAAGARLAELLAPSYERTGDVVRVRRQQVDLAPGDSSLLEALRAAAIADDDKIYARAVEHVLRAFDPGAGPLPPPPLAAQVERPGTMALLARPSSTRHGETLALIYEGATSLFLRDPKSYGITGVERVVPGQTSPLARLYEVAMRVLDTPRIPLFVPRPTGALAASVALLNPPSVVLAGDVREETAELRFVLGRGLSAALHPNVLVLGLPARDVGAVRRALLSAFGPPERVSLDAQSGKLAESFWQVIPPRAQRRLQELLAPGDFPEYEALTGAAHQSGRRVGLFLAGDFGTAARALASEVGVSIDADAAKGAADGLARRCSEIPELADLLRLAVSPEYADARWHPVAPASQRGSISSSRFSIV